MVMLFPDTADRSRQYATSNGQYGQFYGTVIREVQRDDYGRHYECNKKAARLAEELQEAKACLAMVDYQYARPDQGQYAPSGDCCLEERRGPHSRCKCDHRTPGCYENPYKLGSEVKEWDCCESREPEFLEDYVRCYHPRLAPKPQWLPKGWPGQANRSAQLQCGSIDIRPVGSGGFGVGLQSGLTGSGKRRGRSKSPKRVQGCSAGPPPLGRYLPASARYGYYRYYGAAGQGAKTAGDCTPRPQTHQLTNKVLTNSVHGLRRT